MKTVKRVFLVLFIVLLLSAGGIYVYLRLTLPRLSGDIASQAVQAPVEIRRNAWGVPHIRAQNERDLFLAIGFVHAQDRLFQMDLSRRLATGRLSEIFGRRTLEMDIQQKEQLTEEAIASIEKNITPQVLDLIQQYCRGVNLFIDTQRLPPEFRILGYRPEKWQPLDLLTVFKNMESILIDDGDELNHMVLAGVLGEEKAQRLTSGTMETTIIKADEAAPFFTDPALHQAWMREVEHGEYQTGSNNWVVAGSRTDTGLPYLANDPHLFIRFPSYFYQVHCQTPDLELCGNTLPGIPFIIIGRNAHISWGLTNIGTDVVDYFKLTINPSNPDQYYLDGRWENFKTISKVIRIRGGGEFKHRVHLSLFGPIRRQKKITLAEHSIASYPFAIPQASYEMNTARTVEEFIAALKKFSSPAQNVVFADRKGNIGYFPAGRIPLRRRGNGSIPVPGESTADLWQGFVDENSKPYLLNPGRGFIATANNRVLPESSPLIFNSSFPASFRADRIEKLLLEKEKLSIDDMQRIQTDAQVVPAAFLMSRIRAEAASSSNARFVLDRFLHWNLDAASGIAPYLFYTFERHLAHNIFDDEFPDEYSRKLISTSWLYRILGYPQREIPYPDEFASWVDDRRTPAKETFNDMVEKSLAQTYDGRQKAMREGIDLNWEKLHRITYEHPLGAASILRPFFNRGPYPMAGGRDCIMTASFNFGQTYPVTLSSTFRMIIDMSDSSRSLLVNSSGQSGHFLSPYYADQIPLFLSGRYRPMEIPPTPDAGILRLVPGRK